MNLSPRTRVTDAIGAHPHAAEVLAILGIDFCCRRENSLAEASAAAGLDPAEVVDLLSDSEVPAESPPSTDAPLSELTRYVVSRFHRGARKHLTGIVPLAAQTCWAHGQKSPELCALSEMLQKVAQSLVPHMRNEETLLFPYIETMESDRGRDTTIVVPLFGTVEYPLQLLRHEHSSDMAILRELRTLTRDFTPPAQSRDAIRDLYQKLREFASELQEHTEFEDHVLFPRAVAREKAVTRRA